MFRITETVILMNAKEFERRLAARMPLKSSLLEEMLRETHEIVCKRFADSDSLDVPKFGTFEIAKQLEQIIPQPESGNRLLTPPD